MQGKSVFLIRFCSVLLVTLLQVNLCFAEAQETATHAESTENVHPEVFEAIHEAPDVVEDLVLAPPHEISKSPWPLAALIFSISFGVEEAAVGASAYLIGTHKISAGFGFAALFAGVFFSDLFIYLWEYSSQKADGFAVMWMSPIIKQRPLSTWTAACGSRFLWRGSSLECLSQFILCSALQRPISIKQA